MAPAPPSRVSRGLRGAQSHHDPPPPHIPPATASSPPAYTTPQSRAPPRSPAAPPRRGRCHPAPQSFVALGPRSPPRHSDLPRSARSARADRGRRAAAGKCRQLLSPAASRAAAGRREGTGKGGEEEGEGAGAKVQASRAPAAPPSPPTPAPAVPTPKPCPTGVGAWDSPSPSPPSLPRTVAGLEPGSGGGSEPEEGREGQMPTYLPRAAPGNFPKVLAGAERKAGESRSPPRRHHHPTRARTVAALVCPSVRPPPASPRAGRRGGADSRDLSSEQPACARRQAPPAGLQLPAAPPPHRRVLSPRSRAAFSPARQGACKLRRRRRAALPGKSPEHGAPAARPGPAARGAPR